MDCQSHLFQLPEGIHFLNAAYMSPQLRQVQQAGIEAIAQKNYPGMLPPTSFFESSDRLRASLGRFLSCDVVRLALIPSVSYGMAIVAKNLAQKHHLAAGQHIVTVQHEFPSDIYAWQELVDEKGLKLTTIQAPETRVSRGKIWNEKILEAIDANCAMVVIGHIHWADGTLFDLEAIGKACRKQGAWLVLDLTQSLGALPFSLATVQPDALICAGYKWMMGPYSLGFGYFGPAFDQGKALEQSWVNRKNSDDFTSLTQYHNEYRPGAYRYNVGQQSNFILNPMLQAAVEQLIAWQPSHIQQYCQNLVAAPIETLKKWGYYIEDKPYRASHLFGIGLSTHHDLEHIMARLSAHQVQVSMRGASIRVSPHVYNSPADIEALLAALEP